MTTLHPTTQLLAPRDEPIAPDEAELAAVAFLARYSGRTLDAFRHDLCNLFQWQPITACPCSRRPAPISRCTDRRWRNAVWPPRRSTGGCRQRAVTTASPTSTAVSRPIPPSASAGPPSIRQSSAGWTAESSDDSC